MQLPLQRWQVVSGSRAQPVDERAVRTRREPSWLTLRALNPVTFPKQMLFPHLLALGAHGGLSPSEPQHTLTPLPAGCRPQWNSMF